jgi:hypothetical protein
MQSTIGMDAVLSKTLKDTTDLAYKSFYDAIETQCRALLRVGLVSANFPDYMTLTIPTGKRRPLTHRTDTYHRPRPGFARDHECVPVLITRR